LPGTVGRQSRYVRRIDAEIDLRREPGCVPYNPHANITNSITRRV
jgi:hypothetical protein